MQILNVIPLDNMKNFDLATIITFVTALTALLTSIYSIYHSRKTTYINAITVSRLKYIENLRKYISEFCALVLHTANTKLDDREVKEYNEKINQLRYTIMLHLNRKDYFDKIFLMQLVNIQNFPEHSKKEEHKNAILKLSNYSQDIFTLEWAGIKLEASKGNLFECQRNKLKNKHKKTYGE